MGFAECARKVRLPRDPSRWYRKGLLGPRLPVPPVSPRLPRDGGCRALASCQPGDAGPLRRGRPSGIPQADDACRIARHDCPRGNVVQDDTPRADLAAIAKVDPAEQNAACAQIHIVAHGGDEFRAL